MRHILKFHWIIYEASYSNIETSVQYNWIIIEDKDLETLLKKTRAMIEITLNHPQITLEETMKICFHHQLETSELMILN